MLLAMVTLPKTALCQSYQVAYPMARQKIKPSNE